VGRPLFWFAGPLSAAQRTTEMIADQRTGYNSGPALADNRNEASAIPLFYILWPNFKNISKRRKYQIIEVSGIAKCGIANCGMEWTTVKIVVAE
jgi:hypothetical protein